MKRFLSIWAISAIVATSAAAGPGTANTASTSDAEREVLALEDQWVQAEIHRDGAALQRILDDRFIVTFSSGTTVDKSSFIEGIVSDKDTMLSQELTDRIVLVEGNTVVVVETDTVKGKNAAGEPWTIVLRITTTYVKRDGRWVALAEQMASIKVPKVSGN